MSFHEHLSSLTKAMHPKITKNKCFASLSIGKQVLIFTLSHVVIRNVGGGLGWWYFFFYFFFLGGGVFLGMCLVILLIEMSKLIVL